jgi:predicted dehydrogenase
MASERNRPEPVTIEPELEAKQFMQRRRFLQSTLSAAAAMGMTGMLSNPAMAGAQTKHTLLILNPGHFHAGLTLRSRDSRLADDVYVYAEQGADVDNFIRMVETFNNRPSEPTGWKLHVYRGADYLERLRTERRGDIVVISGKNDTKMASIQQLHGDGFYVLGDKPWLIDTADEGRLRQVATTLPLAMDIMTERHQIASRLQRALARNPAVFGAYRRDGNEPAIYFKSIHHLYKIVNNRPLIRPYWFFDTSIQGEGMTDVTTHLVDLAQWMTSDGSPFDYERDVTLEAARQWPTAVPLEIYSQITGLNAFPEAVRAHVDGGSLQYLCNAGISYRLRGIPVQIESQWNLKIPEGGGDTHYSVLRGTRADLVVDQGTETGYLTRLTVRPMRNSREYESELNEAVADLQAEFPSVACEPDGAVYRISIPGALRTGHESHFAEVLETFLGYIDAGTWPPQLGPDIVTKYTLLVRAKQLSHATVS